jgi:hypothetical protein
VIRSYNSLKIRFEVALLDDSREPEIEVALR